MKRIIIYLAHPAHFHLFKNVIKHLSDLGGDIIIFYNYKDVLEELILSHNFENVTIVKIKSKTLIKNKIDLLVQFIQKLIGTIYHTLKFRPDLIIGTPIIIAFAAKIAFSKSIIVNEDDFDVIEKTANLGYPFATNILCPIGTRTGKFENKAITYRGLHELAYLHPDHFSPDPTVLEKYGLIPVQNYILMRFSSLNAHHDVGISGIDDKLALEMIEYLNKYQFKVIITSERKLSGELEKYRLALSAIDIHHIMAFSKIFIGDSQTMAAESAVLGVPYIRYNSFVGKISYLDEIEKKYRLGYGIFAGDKNKLIETLKTLSADVSNGKSFQNEKKQLLNDKINTAKFMADFFYNYS